MTAVILDRSRASARRAPHATLLLVLLGILLAAALGRRASLPQTAAATPAGSELRLQIDSAGDYTLDGRRVSAAGLDDALQAALVQAPDARLRIASADDSNYQAFVGAMAVAERAGVRNIASEMR